MVNNEFSKDIAKHVKNSDLGSGRELKPGEMGRRYEPTLGVKKHNERIHKESKQMDKYGNLPFSFSKPDFGKGPAPSSVQCDNCGRVTSASVNTIGIICRGCNTYSSVTQLNR